MGIDHNSSLYFSSWQLSHKTTCYIEFKFSSLKFFFPDDDIDLTRYVYLIREGIVLYSQDIRFTVYKFFWESFFDLTLLIITLPLLSYTC